MKTKLFLFAFLTVFFSCELDESGSEPQPLRPKEINISQSTADMINGDNAFGLLLFQEILSRDDITSNVFISPTSIALALAMTYNGARGDTKTAMEVAMKKQGLSVDEINSGYKSLIGALISVDPKVLISIANSIWYSKDLTVLQEFVTINQTYYNAQVSALDFNNPSALTTINNWVNDQTKGRIKEILDNIPAEAAMYLINAIYFKGMWHDSFDKENTKNGIFYLKDGSAINTPMMSQDMKLKTASNELFTMVDLPYGQGNFSMVVMIPQSGHTTGEITSELTTENWDGWMGNLVERSVTLSLPKFTFEYNNQLIDVLSAMGMEVAFSDAADFSGINGTGHLKISRVLHKTFVEVNEEGTEAAAVTAVEIIYTSAGPVNITIDHPFLFAIREVKTGTILFIGRVQNPTVKSN